MVLGVSGSVAAYRAADLARDLMRAGCTVRACLTPAAAKFVTPALFEALTGEPCLVDTFDEPVAGRMAHIDWARDADLLLIAPASANTMARIANGIAEDMLSTIALVYDGPMVIAPAMNPTMYAAEPIQSAAARLRERAAVFVDPDDGIAVCGETGQGKLAPNDTIVAAALTVLRRSQRLAGHHVLITSGPTQEPLDDVRYLTNRSTGKMGAALARAALLMGAKVTVIAGPSSAAYPLAAQTIRVRTADEMLQASHRFADSADWIIGAAAVADYRPKERRSGKLRRTADEMTVELVANPDVLANLAAATKPEAIVVGFAAEPGPNLDYAREKMVRKGLHAIAANDVGRADIGFESDANELSLIFREGDRIESGHRSKLACALWLFETVLDRRER